MATGSAFLPLRLSASHSLMPQLNLNSISTEMNISLLFHVDSSQNLHENVFSL